MLDYQRYIPYARFSILIAITINQYIINLNDIFRCLQDYYLQLNIINPKEQTGGHLNYISLGLVYEKRENKYIVQRMIC
jgi:hypothetical protein